MDPLTSVVGGLAVVAHEDGGLVPTLRRRLSFGDHPVVHDIRAKSERPYEVYDLRVGSQVYADSPDLHGDPPARVR